MKLSQSSRVALALTILGVLGAVAILMSSSSGPQRTLAPPTDARVLHAFANQDLSSVPPLNQEMEAIPCEEGLARFGSMPVSLGADEALIAEHSASCYLSGASPSSSVAEPQALYVLYLRDEQDPANQTYHELLDEGAIAVRVVPLADKSDFRSPDHDNRDNPSGGYARATVRNEPGTVQRTRENRVDLAFRFSHDGAYYGVTVRGDFTETEVVEAAQSAHAGVPARERGRPGESEVRSGS